MTTKRVESAGGISDETVRDKTGKGWNEWFALLDEAGAAKMPHKDIAAYVQERHGIPGWWAQSVTVAYERERGLREKHQTPDGYQAGASKTVAAPLASLYQAWADEAKRDQWLPEAIKVTKMTENKSLRGTSANGRMRISANFYPKGSDKSYVSLQIEKLANAGGVAQVKAYWGSALDQLKTMLEQ